jgi:hypothetical protein
MDLARRDSAAAQEYVEQHASAAERKDLLAVTVEGWAQQDPPAALQWVRDREQESPLSGDPNALHGVFRAAIEADPFGAEQVADSSLQIAPPALREGALGGVVAGWGRRAPEEAVRWLVGHADRVPNATFGLMASLASRSDAAMAAAYTARIPAQAQDSWIAGALLSILLHASASSATALPFLDSDVLRAFDSDATRQRNLLLVVMEVAKKDPAATRSLNDDYVLDPTTREQAEEALAAATGHRVYGTTFSLGR